MTWMVANRLISGRCADLEAIILEMRYMYNMSFAYSQQYNNTTYASNKNSGR